MTSFPTIDLLGGQKFTQFKGLVHDESEKNSKGVEDEQSTTN